MVKDVKTLVVFDVESEMAMDSMKWKCGYIELIWGTPFYFAFLR